SASTDGAAPITPSTTKDASVRILNSNEEINPGNWAKPTPGAWFHPQEQTTLPGDVARRRSAGGCPPHCPLLGSGEASWWRAEAFGGERRPTPDSNAEPEHDAGAAAAAMYSNPVG